jgi:hypothetical protein
MSDGWTDAPGRRRDGVNQVGQSRAAQLVQPWHVRILGPDGVVAGAGVLVDAWHVLTGATVAAGDVGATGEVGVHFPGNQSGTTGVGTSEACVPAYGRGGDPERPTVCLLRLAGPAPPDLVRATLAPCGPGDRRQVRLVAVGSSLGDPPDLVRLDGVLDDDGVFLTGGPDGQLSGPDAQPSSATSLGSGLVGTGAVDPATGAVIGVVVEEQGRLHVLRTDALADALPYLAPLLGREAQVPRHPAMPRRPVVPERAVGEEELHLLFSLLWTVPGMADRVGRSYYLSALGRRLGTPFAVGAVGDDAVDVWALLVALLEWPGALRELALLLQQLDPNHPVVLRLVEHVALGYPDLLLLQAERVALEQYLVGVDWRKIGTAHRFATRSFGALPWLAPETVGKVVRDLESRGSVPAGASPERVPVLLVFVEHVAHAIGGRLSIELHGWLGAVAGRLGMARAARHEVCDEADRQASSPHAAHLVVILEPDGIDPDLFLLSAVVMTDGEPERSIFRDDEARTLAEVERVLDDEILRRVPDAVGGGESGIVLEVVLPHRLLGTPVERWTFDRDRMPRELGIRYPVVVRALERVLDPSARDAWVAATERLHRYASRPDVGGALHHVTAPAAAAAGGGGSVVPPGTVVVTVPFPPEADDESNPFAAWIHTGVPVILWSREPVDPEAFGRWVRGQLLADGPAELPNRVRLWQRAGRAGVPAVGLLYDDATRIPSQLTRRFRLRPPRATS